MRRLLYLCAILLAVVGCASPSPFADDASIAAVSYRDPGTSSLTLYTMVNNRTGAGGHSALLINASEQVIFDPAGSFYADIVPERNDVLFGITPGIERAYRSAHARSTHHVVSQTVQVTAAQAEIAYQLALTAGPVPGAMCAQSISSLLRKVPGFEPINTTYYPVKLQEQFETIPGVQTEKLVEEDEPDLNAALKKANAKLNTAPSPN
ncbi:hypothetical protein [Falsiphaeobacter marinintestinus]|uniref:hypothetical protein n=1 Tax=Falsiphaeobacter marinintestinus TaxID=1492905 RepID=UPI0011B4925E|nr:hypothetical protein [Phaeobacter marinintestinus]